MLNNVCLTGRLTKKIELKNTQNGIAVGSFTLAVNRRFTDENGEKKADFINCVIWRKQAENLAKFTDKGSLIGVEGSLQTRSYQNSDGKTVFVTEVLCNNFSLLESKKQATQDNAWDGTGFNENDLPF